MKTGHTQPPPKISKGISSVTFASAPAALSLHNVAIRMNQQIISLIYACHLLEQMLINLTAHCAN